jgi:hypothetical protein
MSKAERDSRDEASNAESSKVIDAETSQDDIPPVHVLEAALNQDRKETEDLLAGFDRPGRSPKPAARERDFVDYYAKKKPESGSARVSNPSAPAVPTAASGGAPTRSKQAEISTVVVPRKDKGIPVWAAWLGAGFAMALIGGGVSYLATNDSHSISTLPTGPSAATTITTGTPPPTTTAVDNVPLPAPPALITPEPVVTATTTATTTAKPARRDPKSAPSAATTVLQGSSATGDTKPPPRDDFIRDL